jgi:hypothetical protein
MAAKKAKHVKNPDQDTNKAPEADSKQPDISDAFFEQFK